MHIPFLDGIRGLSALYVVFYHFLFWNVGDIPKALRFLLTPFMFGHSAVSVFIVLSGFSLMLGVAASPDKRLRGGFPDYLRRRARRILPPYYAALSLSILSLMIMHGTHLLSNDVDPVTSSSIVTHVLLIHNLKSSWSGQLNVALWSVATEWQIYFVFPLVLIPVWRAYGNTATIISGFLLSFLPSAIVSILEHRVVFYSPGCPWYIGLFATGMVGAALYCQTPQRSFGDIPPSIIIKRLWYGVAVSLLSIILGFSGSGKGVVLNDYTTFSQYMIQTIKDAGTGGLIMCLILLISFNPATEGNFFLYVLRNIMSSKLSGWLSTFSYSLYLTHTILLTITLSLVYKISPIEGWLWRAFVAIPLSILFAYIFYLCFERPTLAKRKAMSGKGAK